jgi:sporulation protein YlmC with PRC-barrel domain
MATSTENDILVKLSDDTLMLDDPSADIRDRKVIDRQGDAIGHVSDLFVDRNEKKVRMLQVAAGGFLGLGDRHFLVPVDAITSVSESEIHIDQTRAKVVGSPAYDPKLSDLPPRDTWAGFYGYYGYPPYWSPGYIYPGFSGIY